MRFRVLLLLSIAAATFMACRPSRPAAPEGQQAESVAASATARFEAPEIADLNRDLVDVGTQLEAHTLTIIDFWASWCGPCLQEMPNMVALYQTYHRQGLNIIGISLDKDYHAWENAVRQQGMEWTQLSELRGWDDTTARRYGIRSIPHTMLIARDGTIVAQGLRGEQLRLFVEDFLTRKTTGHRP